jgi:hypothetical protein
VRHARTHRRLLASLLLASLALPVIVACLLLVPAVALAQQSDQLGTFSLEGGKGECPVRSFDGPEGRRETFKTEVRDSSKLGMNEGFQQAQKAVKELDGGPREFMDKLGSKFGALKIAREK